MTPADTNPLREALARARLDFENMPYQRSIGSLYAHRDASVARIDAALASEPSETDWHKDFQARTKALASEPVAGTGPVARKLDVVAIISKRLRENRIDGYIDPMADEIIAALCAPAPAGREAIAKIIDPNFLFWDFAVPNSFQQKRKDRALARADAILALGTTVPPQGRGPTSSPPPVRTTHNSGEGDPSVMPDSGGGETTPPAHGAADSPANAGETDHG